MAEIKQVEVILQARHTDKGTEYPAGTHLWLDPGKAKWLIGRGTARRVVKEPAKEPVKGGSAQNHERKFLGGNNEHELS